MDNLIKYLKRVKDLEYIVSILNWELNTIAPIKSISYLCEVKSKYELEIFDLMTSYEYKEILEKANSESLDLIDSKYIKLLKENYEKEKKVPKTFIKKYNSFKDQSLIMWKKAKENNDYKIFEEYLEKIIEYTKELYKYMYNDDKNIYEYMIEDYEKGIKVSEIDKLFSEIKKELIPLIKKQKIKYYNDKYSNFNYEDIYKKLLKYIGFDNSRGAIGIYTHPYTVKINNDDIRITFSKEDSIIDQLFSIIHEGGHAIFEQNINENLKKYPIYEIDKVALHESQSRFYENILGRNKNFWIPIYDDISKKISLDMSLDEFVNRINSVNNSKIRIKADELTYPIHIIIRYEIERDLFNGKIKVKDLKNIWNQKYKEYLNLDIENDREGILQDMHWADGSFGYFPCYLLGSIFDGMLYYKINNEVGSIDKLLKEKKVSKITKYLNDNIHKYGGTYNINEVSKNVIGKSLSSKELINYLKEKYDN